MSGPDNLSSRVLKELADVMVELFREIFQAGLYKSKVPGQWRLANVISVFKKGDRSNAANYRPVSLPSIW